MSFLIAKDMSYFTVDVMAVLNHYNNKVSLEECKKTIGSNFEPGNAKCQEIHGDQLYSEDKF